MNTRHYWQACDLVDSADAIAVAFASREGLDFIAIAGADWFVRRLADWLELHA